MKLSSRAVTRIAFSIIIVFVLAQVIWWIIFQNLYIASVTDKILLEWQQDVAVANAIVTELPSQALQAELLARYPQLDFDTTTTSFSLNERYLDAFMREQNRSVRMFAYEGPFFVLVILIGLWIIARSLHTERELKLRQQNFLSAISHEFKTPISTLRLLIETALMRKLSHEKQTDYLRRMEAELSRLEHTSEQVLASARLEQSKEAPILEPFELNNLVQTLLTNAKAGLEAKGAKLSVSYAQEALDVSLDYAAFTLVLNNLLDNAVKYSPEPKKTINVKLELNGDLVLLHVEDEGIGIEASELKHVFERFYRVGSELTRESKGVGLGLHLVKSITEAMNGWVRVEANEPKGTRFTLVLPRRIALTAQEQALSLGNS